MIVEVEKKDELPEFGDLKIGATFYLSANNDDSLFLKVKPHPNTSNNCVNLTKSMLCVCSIRTPVTEVKTKVVNA